MLEGIGFGGHHVEHDAEAVNICVGVVLSIVEHLWRYVTRRAATTEQQLVVLLVGGESEVHQHWFVQYRLIGEHHILWLDVSVQDRLQL